MINILTLLEKHEFKLQSMVTVHCGSSLNTVKTVLIFNG